MITLYSLDQNKVKSDMNKTLYKVVFGGYAVIRIAVSSPFLKYY